MRGTVLVHTQHTKQIQSNQSVMSYYTNAFTCTGIYASTRNKIYVTLVYVRRAHVCNIRVCTHVLLLQGIRILLLNGMHLSVVCLTF